MIQVYVSSCQCTAGVASVNHKDYRPRARAGAKIGRNFRILAGCSRAGQSCGKHQLMKSRCLGRRADKDRTRVLIGANGEYWARARTGQESTREIRVPAGALPVWAELRNMDSLIHDSMRVIRKHSDVAARPEPHGRKQPLIAPRIILSRWLLPMPQVGTNT